MQTTDFTRTHDGVAVTISVPTPLFQQACSSNQWPYMLVENNRKSVEDNRKSLEGLFTKSLQVLSDIFIEMFDNLRYVAIENFALQAFLSEHGKQWLEESLPILNDANAELSPTLNDAMFRYQLYVLENKTAEERLLQSSPAALAGQTVNFTYTSNGVTVAIKVPSSSFQQACSSNQWPYMPVEGNQELLQGACTGTSRLLSEILTMTLENPQYVAIENICLQMFLEYFNNQWSTRLLPALRDSDTGAPLAPVLTDALCWYMLYELKKDRSGKVEALFQRQNPNALALLRFRAFGQPALDREPLIILGNRPN